MKIHTSTVFLFLFPAMLGLAVFRLAPVLIAIVGGFFSQTIRGDTIFVGMLNYTNLFSDDGFWNSLKVTILFNAILNPIQIFLAFILAMLVLKPSPGISVLRTTYVLPMTVAASITATIWNILLNPTLGPVNGILREIGIGTQPFFTSENQALASFIAIATWKGTGYWMLFLLAGLIVIPKDVYEAAAIDGATGWKRFMWITFPLMKRPLLYVLVADTAINFLFFTPVYVISNGGPNGSTSVLMFEAYQAAFVYLDHGRSLAISTIVLLIVMSIAALQFRLMRINKAI